MGKEIKIQEGTVKKGGSNPKPSIPRPPKPPRGHNPPPPPKKK